MQAFLMPSSSVRMRRAIYETHTPVSSNRTGGIQVGTVRTPEDTRRRIAYLELVSTALGELQGGMHEELLNMEEQHVRKLRSQAHIPRNFVTIQLHEPRTFYKVVAAVGTKLVSIFDGTTEYHLGRIRLAPRGACGYAPLDCCSFVWPTPQQAVNAAFPASAKALHAPRVLAKVTCWGRGYVDERYQKYAFAYTRVDRFITDAVEGFGYIPTVQLLKDRYSYIDLEAV